MKSQKIVLPSRRSAFSLLELMFLLFVIAVLAGIALPVFSGVSVKGAQTKALSNAKQIGLALRLYASDNDGAYPSYTLKNGKPTKTVVPDSNTAFAQLFPDYVQEENIFWLPKSAFCSPNPPDEITDNPPRDTPVDTLKKGENEWAYVVGLNDSSNPAVPLIASGFADPKQHTYTKDPSRPGGVFKGATAIVIRSDTSGAVMKVDQATMTVVGPNGGTENGDIFTPENGGNGWLKPENFVVNPK